MAASMIQPSIETITVCKDGIPSNFLTASGQNQWFTDNTVMPSEANQNPGYSFGGTVPVR